MIFIETSVFTRQVLSLLTDDEYRKFQLFLSERPAPVLLSREAAVCGKCDG